MTNYYGSRQAMVHYVASVKQKRLDLVELLDRLVVWRISMWVANGVLELPAGWQLGDIKWNWIAASIPWYAPDKETASDILCVQNSFRTRSDIIAETAVGTGVYVGEQY